MPETLGGPPDASSPDPERPSPDQGTLDSQLQALRHERDELQAKLQQIAQVIGAPDADRILHDLRNVMNELVLLRSLADLE